MSKKTPATYNFSGFDEENGVRVNEEREVAKGTPCTFYVGTDAFPAFVSRVSDSGKTIWIKQANAEPDKENGFDYFSNQVYIITPNENSKEVRVSKRKNGVWVISNSSRGLHFGRARYYQDPHL